jgi:hypothetical protein
MYSMAVLAGPFIETESREALRAATGLGAKQPAPI